MKVFLINVKVESELYLSGQSEHEQFTPVVFQKYQQKSVKCGSVLHVNNLSMGHLGCFRSINTRNIFCF